MGSRRSRPRDKDSWARWGCKVRWGQAASKGHIVKSAATVGAGSQTPVQKWEPVENGAKVHRFRAAPVTLQQQEKLKQRKTEAGS